MQINTSHKNSPIDYTSAPKKVHTDIQKVSTPSVNTESKVDMSKVEDMKRRIASGQYKVNPSSISDKLLQDPSFMKNLLQ